MSRMNIYDDIQILKDPKKKKIKFIAGEKLFSPMLDSKTTYVPLTSVEYRKLKCKGCKKILSPKEFYSKSKGTEGPIKSHWSKKESVCKACSRQKKAKRYKKMKSLKRSTEIRRATKNAFDPLNCEIEFVIS